MYKLNNLVNPYPNKKKFRVGRGPGSGSGKNCGYGNKGQKSRSGRGKEDWFEGGQTPIYKRLPHLKGLKNKSHKNFKEIAALNLRDIVKYFNEGDVVNLDTLKEKGLVEKKVTYLKILGEGEIEYPLTFEASSFSKKAKEKIEKVNGKVTIKR
ncbi:MAG: 50S ribosomal protein L15 [Caldisericia bacterium]